MKGSVLKRNKMVFISRGCPRVGSSQFGLRHIMLVVRWWRMRPITDWAETTAQMCKCPWVVVRFSWNRQKKATESRNIRDCKISVVSDWRSLSYQILEIVSAILGKYFTGFASWIDRSVSSNSQVGKLTLDPFEADFQLLNLLPPSKKYIDIQFLKKFFSTNNIKQLAWNEGHLPSPVKLNIVQI